MDPDQAAHTKNRYGQLTPINVMLYPGKGVINAYLLRKMLETFGFIKGAKAGYYSLSPELIEYLGQEALDKAGVKNVESVPRKPTLNKLCSMNNDTLIQFFKEQEMYKMIAKEDEEDDGLF
jgi:hypothetical protein